MKRKAFTLLELLISATLFSAIAAMMVGVLATSSSVQESGQRSQGATAQFQRALQAIQSAVSRSSAMVTINSDAGGSAAQILVVPTYGIDRDGKASDVSHYEIFCIQSGKLIQYVLPENSVGNLSSVTTCNPNAFDSIFSPSGVENFITDEAVSVQLLQFRGLQNTATASSPADALAIEVGGVYAGRGEKRATEAANAPMILRGVSVPSFRSNPLITNLSQ